MLTSQKIKDSATTHFDDSGIPIVDGLFTSPIHHVLAQYEEVRKAYNWMDARAFDLGHKFLQAVVPLEPDNLALRAVSLMNSLAFKPLSETEIEFLEANEKTLRQDYGIDLDNVIAPAWEELGKTEREILARQKICLRKDTIDDRDLSHLIDALYRANPQTMESRLNAFADVLFAKFPAGQSELFEPEPQAKQLNLDFE